MVISINIPDGTQRILAEQAALRGQSVEYFRVLRRLEQKLQPVFDAAGNAPWSEQRKNYIGRSKIKEIIELRSQGVKIAEIARKIGVSSSTIYRHLPQDLVGNDEVATKDQ